MPQTAMVPLPLMAIPLALLASLAFSFASTIFTDFSRQVSAKWINCFKLTIAFFCFAIASLILREEVSRSTIPLYLLSGALGLFTADHFLCSAFAKMGSARTLIIFSFSPLFVAGWCFLFWGETLPLQKLIAIIFFMACVFTLSLEKFKKEGHWEIPGLLMAVSGILLDALGNVITSYGFKSSPNDGVLSVCALRAGGAFFLFLALSLFIKVRLMENFKKLPLKRKSIALGASVIGTFLSITLWISAVKRGNLTTLAALAGINPLFAACFEIVMGKSKATSFLITAFLLFGTGFYFLVIY